VVRPRQANYNTTISKIKNSIIVDVLIKKDVR
jgi:hypothetical protein